MKVETISCLKRVYNFKNRSYKYKNVDFDTQHWRAKTVTKKDITHEIYVKQLPVFIKTM